MLDLDIVKHDLKVYRVDVIKKTKKDEDNVYDDIIIKKDKEFFYSVECFSYNCETKTFTVDPKEAYLYPNDDDEDDIDELEEEEEESSTEKT